MKTHHVPLALLSASTLLALPSAHGATLDVANVQELRDALITASSNAESDTIRLAAGTYSTQSDGQGPFVYISDNTDSLTLQALDGSNATPVILDGADQDLVLEASSQANGGSLSISGLQIKNGRRGLEVTNLHLNLSGSTIADNQIASADTDWNGASGLRVSGNVDVSISNCTFQNNRSLRSESYYGNGGGAAYIDTKSLTIAGTTFTENESAVRGGALDLSGGINDTVSIVDTRFVGNLASRATVSTSCDGAAIYAGSSRLTIARTLFFGNNSRAGAVCIENKSTIDQSRFSNNVARDGVAAIRIGGYDSLLLTNSVFLANQAGGTGEHSSVLHAYYGIKAYNNLFIDNVATQDFYLKSGSTRANNNTNYLNLIFNNVFMDAERTAITGAAEAFAYVKNNFVDMSKVAIAQDKLFQEGNIHGDAPGVDGEYRPVSGSALIDKGLGDQAQLTLPVADADNHARVAGAAVDIGPYEFGAEQAQISVSSFALVTATPKILAPVTLEVTYTLPEGRTLASSVLIINDDAANPETVTLDQSGRFSTVFIEPGNYKLVLVLTDSAGVAVQTTRTVAAGTLPIADVITRAQESCKQDLAGCGVDLAVVGKSCKDDPAACGLDVDAWRKEGIQSCVTNPSGCGITGGEPFNPASLPTAEKSWKLLGTGKAITDLNVFNGVSIVWILENTTWKAWSPDKAVKDALAAKNIPAFTSIPANSGFWVRK